MVAQEVGVLTESQLAALEQAKADKEAHGEFESEHPGYCVAQDTFYVGTLKGVGRAPRIGAADPDGSRSPTRERVGGSRPRSTRTRRSALPPPHAIGIACGPREGSMIARLAVENIDHARTKTKSPQPNGICERFDKTRLDEFYRVAFRKRVYQSLDELQADLDAWMASYNEVRTHQGRWCFANAPMRTLLDRAALARKKMQQGRAARIARPTASSRRTPATPERATSDHV